MKRIYIYYFLLMACQPIKEQTSDPCFIEQWGSIYIQNYSLDKYAINIDGLIMVIIDGSGTTTIEEVPVKTYQVWYENLRTGGKGRINDGISINTCETSLLPIVF